MIFEVEDAGYHRIYGALGPGKIVTFTEKNSDTAPSLAANVKAVAFLRSTFEFPPQVWAFSKDSKPHRIDTFNDDLVKQWDLGPSKEITYKGADGDDVQMWPASIRPNSTRPRSTRPSCSSTAVRTTASPPTSASAGTSTCSPARGTSSPVRISTAPPASAGSSRDSITGDMATKPFEDVMKATDWLESQPYVDQGRIAAIGASYGGYMMAWLNGHTDRFKTMVCHAGVYNWHSMMASDFVRSRERALGSLPWGDLANIDKQSPQRFAANFKTPTLVTHGEKDFRVPVTQGLEYYNTLRQKGVPTRLVYFPDENRLDS